MITRAVIEEIVSSNQARVRILRLNKAKESPLATPTKELYIASICTAPGQMLNYLPGDTVFVGFEDNDDSLPIILGKIQSLDLVPGQQNLKIDGTVQLNNISWQNLKTLENSKKNIAEQLEELRIEIRRIQNLIGSNFRIKTEISGDQLESFTSYYLGELQEALECSTPSLANLGDEIIVCFLTGDTAYQIKIGDLTHTPKSNSMSYIHLVYAAEDQWLASVEEALRRVES